MLSVTCIISDWKPKLFLALTCWFSGMSELACPDKAFQKVRRCVLKGLISCLSNFTSNTRQGVKRDQCVVGNRPTPGWCDPAQRKADDFACTGRTSSSVSVCLRLLCLGLKSHIHYRLEHQSQNTPWTVKCFLIACILTSSVSLVSTILKSKTLALHSNISKRLISE